MQTHNRLSNIYTIVISLIMCLVLTTGCQDSNIETNDHESTAAHNEELAMQYIEAYNERDIDTLERILADPFQYDDNDLDRNEFLALVQGFWNAFPDIVLEPTHIVGADDYVTIRMEFTGTGEGDFSGHDVDGKEIRATETILFGISKGQLSEYLYNWDELSFWTQLDVIESPYSEE